MEWVDRNLFPFTSRFGEIDGHRIHYVDEGAGDIILFVHGTPEWSFGYRLLIKGLSDSYRCIALDHLGFGLSEKPKNENYTTKLHAERLEKFIASLRLENINLVANDFGGSMALHYAINHPDNVRRICLFNTWMWSLNQDPHFAKPARMMKTWLGRFLYKQLNFPVKVMLPMAFGDKSKLTKEVHHHYKRPLSKPADRNGTYTFVNEILDAGPWWDDLWKKLDMIKHKPFLFFWGMKDKLILPKELVKWEARLPNAQVIRFENAGHFVQEEESDQMIHHLKVFFN